MAHCSARLVVFTVLLASCHPGKATMTHHSPRNDARARLKGAEFRRDQARFAAPRASVDGNRDYDVLGYALKGRFDWDRRTLDAKVDVTLRLASAETSSIQLDSRVSQINLVRIGTLQPAYTVDPDAGTLDVDLTGLSAAERAGEIRLTVSYARKATEDGDSGDHFDGSALRAIQARPGDPVAARTVNTMSEPLSASQWMPCKDDVSDRATFAVELTLPQDESLIANGNLIKDQYLADGARVMGYRTEYTLPTYLMAFAAGEFDVTTTQLNGMPIGVWARRGLPVDTTGVLTNLKRLITRYTELVGPYAFDKYMIVFLPEFGGGEEHAGITFQNEADGSDTQGAGDLTLIGHELGHQWFGDYMTVRTWDDLWIKEGMASLLEAESTRPWEDQQHRGNLFGSFQWVQEGDAVIDPALDPDAKYTSGPYGRAAWVLTQMRALLGDERFFATLRQILQDHAYGTITTAEFLAAFRPGLGDDVIAKIELALKAKKLPQLAATTADDGKIHLALTDEEHALFAPLDLTRHAKGSSERTVLVAGQDLVLDPGDTRPVTFDSLDAHAFQVRQTTASAYSLLPAPLAPELLQALDNNSQTWALTAPSDWQVTPTEYLALSAELGGEIAKAMALKKACVTAAKADDASKALWRSAVDETLGNLPLKGLSSWYADSTMVDFSACLAVATPGILDSDFALLQVNPAALATRPVYVEALATLALDPLVALARWAPAAQSAPTLRLKTAATRSLVKHLDRVTREAPAPLPTDHPWYMLFRRLLAENRTAEVLPLAIQAVKVANDHDALPLLADVAANFDLTRVRTQAVCAARMITDGTDGEFARFAAPLLALETLPNGVRKALTDATTCATP